MDLARYYGRGVVVVTHDRFRRGCRPRNRHVGQQHPWRARPMHFGRAAQRVDDAGELDQQPVAGCLDDAATVLGDFGIDHLTPVRLQPRQGPFLVRADQPAVPRDIRSKNAGQPAFDTFPSQSGAP